MRRLGLACVLFFLVVTFSHGQNAGVVGIQTQILQIFSAQSTTLSSGGTWQCNNSTTPIACPFFPDRGYGTNTLTYCTNAFKGTITLEWVPSGLSPGTPIILTQASYNTLADTACHSLQVGGYYPNMRSTLTPSAGSVSAYYTAQATSIPNVSSGLGTNGPSSPINCDLTAVQTNLTGVASSIANIVPINTGDTIIICGFSISFGGATTTGSLAVDWSTSTSTCSSGAFGGWNELTTSATPQLFTVNLQLRPPPSGASPCFSNGSGATAEITVTYASVHGL